MLSAAWRLAVAVPVLWLFGRFCPAGAAVARCGGPRWAAVQANRSGARRRAVSRRLAAFVEVSGEPGQERRRHRGGRGDGPDDGGVSGRCPRCRTARRSLLVRRPGSGARPHCCRATPSGSPGARWSRPDSRSRAASAFFAGSCRPGRPSVLARSSITAIAWSARLARLPEPGRGGCFLLQGRRGGVLPGRHQLIVRRRGSRSRSSHASVQYFSSRLAPGSTSAGRSAAGYRPSGEG